MSSRAGKILNMVLPKTNNSLKSQKQEANHDLSVLIENKNSPMDLQKSGYDSLFSCKPSSIDLHNDSLDTNSIPDSQIGLDLDISFDEYSKKTIKIVEESSSDSDNDCSSSSDSKSGNFSSSDNTEDGFSSDDSVKDPDYQMPQAELESDNDSLGSIKKNDFSPKPGTSGVSNMHSTSSVLPLVAVAIANEGAEKLLVDGNNQFAAKLFTEVAKNEAGKSVVMSGFSALSPLAQLGLASVGDSHDEILRTIGMPDDIAIKEAFSLVNHNLKSAKGVELKVANRVYIPNDGELNTTFAEMSRDIFSSDVQKVDFSKNVEAAATINVWVEDNTNKRIKDLVDPDSLDESTMAVLVNAIYFKGSWQTKFKKELTQDRDFHVSNEKTIKVPTMFRNGDFKYGRSEELDAQLLELPYEGEEAAFLVVLPNKIDGITQLEEKLKDPSLLAKAVQNMYETEVDVFLPKFKIETTIDLKEVLKKIGVTKLFNPKEAKLNYLLKEEGDGLYVSNAIQKAFIEVNEEGAEAAAASEYGIKLMSLPPRVMANKPFYFELKSNKATLFSGSVNEPYV